MFPSPVCLRTGCEEFHRHLPNLPLLHFQECRVDTTDLPFYIYVIASGIFFANLCHILCYYALPCCLSTYFPVTVVRFVILSDSIRYNLFMHFAVYSCVLFFLVPTPWNKCFYCHHCRPDREIHHRLSTDISVLKSVFPRRLLLHLLPRISLSRKSI